MYGSIMIIYLRLERIHHRPILLRDYCPIIAPLLSLLPNNGSIMVQFAPTLFCHLLLKPSCISLFTFHSFARFCMIMRNFCVIMRDNKFLHLYLISPINYIYQQILSTQLLQSFFETLLIF